MRLSIKTEGMWVLTLFGVLCAVTVLWFGFHARTLTIIWAVCGLHEILVALIMCRREPPAWEMAFLYFLAGAIAPLWYIMLEVFKRVQTANATGEPFFVPRWD